MIDYSAFAIPKLPRAKKPSHGLKRTVLRAKPRAGAADDIRVLPDGREICRSRAAWQRRREECYERDGGRCQHCGRHLGRREYEVDHIRKRSLGRDDRLKNLRVLCGGPFGCHEARRITEECPKK